MEKFWGILGSLVDFLGALAMVFLALAFAFSIGYHVGFTSGLDTKVTWVGEKYTMKAIGTGKR